MEVQGLSLPLVFLAGVVSFASPCVLPLVPGYVSVITGSVGSSTAPAQPKGLVRASLVFLSGFLLMFIALGASASVIGALVDDHRIWLNRAAGVLIIIFGLSLIGLGWSGTLGARWQNAVQTTAHRGGAFALGIAFAVAWTPCIGPYLAAILNLAAVSAHLQTGALLLLVYGLGLALPFLAVAFGFGHALGLLRALERHYRLLQTVAGSLLITMGVLLLTGRLAWINSYVQRGFEWIGIDWWSSL